MPDFFSSVQMSVFKQIWTKIYTECLNVMYRTVESGNLNVKTIIIENRNNRRT